MARAIDPVCGMEVETDRAAATVNYRTRNYYFCAEACAAAFRADPEQFLRAGRAGEKLERHEPPYTTKGGMTAPKFGSAGSGGAEYERLPERHDDK